MKKIELTQGKIALVDDADFDMLNQRKWCITRSCHVWYAVSAGSLRMHRLILGLKKHDGIIVDHRNGNGLDNRRANLRECSQSVNTQNRHNVARKKTSGYQGVCWDKSFNKWTAYIMQHGIQRTIGRYRLEIEAAKAYDNKAIELFGETAKLNLGIEPKEESQQ